MCIKNGSFKSENKDPEQTFGSEMLTFKKDNYVFHASMLSEFHLIVVCSDSDDQSEQKVKFFDFHESLSTQIRDQGLKDKELSLCLTRYIH
jgi:hypothetical protein